jgi:hypothetical protein
MNHSNDFLPQKTRNRKKKCCANETIKSKCTNDLDYNKIDAAQMIINAASSKINPFGTGGTTYIPQSFYNGNILSFNDGR